MKLRVLFCLFVATLCSSKNYAQRHELGVQIGLSNLVGDIGRTSYILQKPFIHNVSQFGVPFYGGILYRLNFNPYQSLRFNVGYSHIQFSDDYAKEKYRKQRHLGGTNSIYEADAIFEYNFFPVNDEHQGLLSPYIFGGVGGMLANVTQAKLDFDFNRDANGNILNGGPTSPTDFTAKESFSQTQQVTFAVPFGVGLKYKFNYNWAFFGEFMFRPTFTDDLDYSQITEKNLKVTYNKDILDQTGKKSLLQTSPYYEETQRVKADFIKNRQVGNINSKDWVNSITIGVSYSFGRLPCYCER